MGELIEVWKVRLANGDLLIVRPEEFDGEEEIFEDCVVLGSLWYTKEELDGIEDY